MADVQTENGYVRIATELMDEIIRRDFSKRQMAILHLIIRLSYGCQSKDCCIEKLSDFEVAGIYKSDIKKELTYLSNAKVIHWDKEKNVFSLNKNYDIWQINPTKGWDDERMDKLLHDNIKRKKVSKTLTDLKNMVSKTLTEMGVKVSKTLTDELVKHLLKDASNPWESKDEQTLKDSIKDIYIKIDDIDHDQEKENVVLEYEKTFGQHPNGILMNDFLYWIEDEDSKFVDPEKIIIEVIRRAKESKPTKPAAYISQILKRLHEQGLYTLEAVKKHNDEFDKKQKEWRENRGAKVYQYRGSDGPPERKDSITGGQIGWIRPKRKNV